MLLFALRDSLGAVEARAAFVTLFVSQAVCVCLQLLAEQKTAPTATRESVLPCVRPPRHP